MKGSPLGGSIFVAVAPRDTRRATASGPGTFCAMLSTRTPLSRSDDRIEELIEMGGEHRKANLFEWMRGVRQHGELASRHRTRCVAGLLDRHDVVAIADHETHRQLKACERSSVELRMLPECCFVLRRAGQHLLFVALFCVVL